MGANAHSIITITVSWAHLFSVPRGTVCVCFVFWLVVLNCHSRGVYGRQHMGRSPSWWHDGRKTNIYVGYVPPSELIPVSTWWTALLNRVSLPEAPSTPFCFCFCCSVAPISCPTVYVSGLHPALYQVHPLLVRARVCVCERVPNCQGHICMCTDEYAQVCAISWGHVCVWGVGFHRNLLSPTVPIKAPSLCWPGKDCLTLHSVLA